MEKKKKEDFIKYAAVALLTLTIYFILHDPHGVLDGILKCF